MVDTHVRTMTHVEQERDMIFKSSPSLVYKTTEQKKGRRDLVVKPVSTPIRYER